VNYRWFIVALMLHLIAVVIWIGGIAAVTTVMFPAMRRFESNEQKAWMFAQIENRFRPQARTAWLIVGLSGIYMVYSLHAWAWFTAGHFWWMDAMVALWLLFGLMLFLIEPLIVAPRLERELTNEPAKALARIETLHWIILIVSLLVIAAVVAGVQGWV
jgi:uncharacterized membrane protein